jgi:hypothetical protein
MKTKILPLLASLLLIGGGFVACDNNKDYEDLAPADSKIHIRMVEVFDQSPRSFQLYCATEKIYPCVNYPIVAVSETSSNSIDISFKGVIESDFCLTAIGPATTTIDLGPLSEGTYALNLYNGGIKQTGTLVVTADSYEVVFDENATFGFTDKLLNRIPEQTIWGLIGYATAETAPRVNSFLEALVDLGAEKRSYAPGDYRMFWIDEKGEITDYPGALWGYYFNRPFVFHYSGDLAGIDQLVRQYKDEMSIRVATDKGEELRSWMYDR